MATSTTESSAGRTTERSSRRDGEVVQYIGSALDVIHGRWKVRLLFLMARGIHRHGKLLQALPGTSKKVMTGTLRQLERDGLVERTTPGGRSAGVEYGLTPLGWSMSEPLMALAEWGSRHGGDIARAHAQYVETPASAGKRR